MRNSRQGIRSQIILAVLIPMLVITFVITWFTIVTRHADMERSLKNTGDSVGDFLATSAEFGIYAGDRNYLQNLAKGILKTPEVSAASFLNADNTLIAHFGQSDGPGILPPPQCLTQQSYRSEKSWFFCKPVLSSNQNLSDYSEEEAVSTEKLQGWVVLELSLAQLQAQQKNILFVSIAVSIIGMTISLILAIRISRSISFPVSKLTDTVRQLRAGDLSKRAEESGPIETRFLAQGINQLATSVEDSHSNLEIRIASATSKLTAAMKTLSARNNELELTRDELQNAITAKDHFLARMSHELRTPLTTVIGFARLLNTTELTKEQNEYIDTINHASTLLLATIDDILDFSKLQSRALIIEHITFDLEVCLEDLIAMHAYHAYGKSLELVLMIDSDVPARLKGDPTRLKQVINNLLGNAIKFTDQGEVILRVARSARSASIDNNESPQEQNSFELEFQIIDSGIGIAEKNIAELFRPFTQADTSITRRFGGSGLGLIICKQLVELMHGSIEISSVEGSGTEITFYLPFDKAADSFSKPASNNSLEHLHLLAYDSHPWSRRALRSRLAHWSSNLFATASVEQTNRLIRQQAHPFDLVVLGISPAEMEASRLIALLSTIRSDYKGEILLLACINNVQSKIPETILQQFAPVSCLSKPVRREALVAHLEKVAGFQDSSPELLATDSKAFHNCLAGLTILIAEDNTYNRNLIIKLMEYYGANTIEAADGKIAVSHFQNTHCDLVLMDVHMPGMDGIDATKKIVALAADKPIPIIGLTANVIETEERDLLAAGAVDILYKPIDEHKLLAAICEFTGRSYNAKHSMPTPGGILGEQHQALAKLKAEILKLLKELKGFIEGNHHTDAREKVHELLGLCGLFGMHELHFLVKDLQEMLQQQQHTHLAQQLAMIETAMRAFDALPAAGTDT
jgi:two-component system sensor histidine kinase BarA